VGVRDDRRRRGLGRRLLGYAVSWLRATGVRDIVLNVEESKSGARHLYEQAGFELRYTGIGLKGSS